MRAITKFVHIVDESTDVEVCRGVWPDYRFAVGAKLSARQCLWSVVRVEQVPYPTGGTWIKVLVSKERRECK